MNREASTGEINWRPLALIFLGALLLRGLVIWELSQTPFFEILIGDSLGYQLWAERIVAGDWIGEDVFYQAPSIPTSSQSFTPSLAALAVLSAVMSG